MPSVTTSVRTDSTSYKKYINNTKKQFGTGIYKFLTIPDIIFTLTMIRFVEISNLPALWFDSILLFKIHNYFTSEIRSRIVLWKRNEYNTLKIIIVNIIIIIDTVRLMRYDPSMHFLHPQ